MSSEIYFNFEVSSLLERKHERKYTFKTVFELMIRVRSWHKNRNIIYRLCEINTWNATFEWYLKNKSQLCRIDKRLMPMKTRQHYQDIGHNGRKIQFQCKDFRFSVFITSMKGASERTRGERGSSVLFYRAKKKKI